MINYEFYVKSKKYAVLVFLTLKGNLAELFRQIDMLYFSYSSRNSILRRRSIERTGLPFQQRKDTYSL